MIRKVLLIGDIVGQPGMRAIFTLLPQLKKTHNADLTIVNAENACDGFGLTPELADTIFKSGADIITSGNHIWEQNEIYQYLDKNPNILRPANYPDENPGKGVTTFNARDLRYVIINLQGREFMWNINCPFKTADQILRKYNSQADAIIIDFHAENHQEKEALAYYLDGKITVLFGTHTHVQTADNRVLPKGSAFVSDIGATGPTNSIIGFDKEIGFQRSLSYIPYQNEISTNPPAIQGYLLEFDDSAPRTAKNLEPISITLNLVSASK